MHTCTKAECHNKKGMLVPGMAEVIDVEFCPKEYRYYNDSVRIHSEVRSVCVCVLVGACVVSLFVLKREGQPTSVGSRVRKGRT